MEKKIYESHGAPKTAVSCFLLGGFFASVCGILFFVIYQGMGDKIKDEAANLLIIMAVICIVLGICFLSSVPPLKKTLFQIYENHLEGIVMVPIVIGVSKKTYYYNFNQIMGVQVTNNIIILHTQNETKKIALKDKQSALQAFQLLQERIEKRD